MPEYACRSRPRLWIEMPVLDLIKEVRLIVHMNEILGNLGSVQVPVTFMVVPDLPQLSVTALKT